MGDDGPTHLFDENGRYHIGMNTLIEDKLPVHYFNYASTPLFEDMAIALRSF